MGALLSCCKGGHGVLEDDGVEMTRGRHNAGVGGEQQHRPKPVKTAKETEEDRIRAREAKLKAGLAAQQRFEAFEKTPGGRAAKKIAVEAAKPVPPPNQGGDKVLRWQMG